jgi:hypothetical protein
MVDNPIHLTAARDSGNNEQHLAQYRTMWRLRREMGEQKGFQDGEAYCHVHGEASGPTSDDVPCPLPHANRRLHNA